jgi:oligopeptide transport system permease protein
MYLLKRIFEAVFVLFIIVSITFVLLRVIPGGPFDLENSLAVEVRQNLEEKYGLNLPLWDQYRLYISGLMKGDLGESMVNEGQPVSETIAQAFPVSLQLGFYALVISYLIGIPLGGRQARNLA